MNFLPAEIIKKKRNNQVLSEDEIKFFILGYTKGEIPDYQMSALLMAIYFKGMTEKEMLFLTDTMLKSGIVVDFKNVSRFKVDKHSTGGVGDKTSLILGPIVAACGVAVPMISGRGLGHTGGTLDKLESIPGFNTQLNLEQFKKNIEDSNICFIGQTPEICPADKKIYALRDVTATVESLPLICASIMSKKLAEGIDGLVLDVKFGSGAFMKTLAQAEELATALMSIAKGANKKVASLLTNMNQPLGRFAGNSLEVDECVAIMKNQKLPGSEDTRELSLQLSAYMLFLSGKESSVEQAHALAEKTLTSGQAYEKFLELCQMHGGDLARVPRAKNKLDIFLNESGYISEMETERIGVAGIKIKAGRAVVKDIIEPTAGIEFHKKIGDPVDAKTPVFTIYGENLELLKTIEADLKSSVKLSATAVEKPALVAKILF